MNICSTEATGHRLAMRQGTTVNYLYGSHLGSTSLVTDASGAVVLEARYEPYGRVYWQWGATQMELVLPASAWTASA